METNQNNITGIKYKLVGRVPAIPRDCNSFDAFFIHSTATDLAKKAGAKDKFFYWGTPKHEIGYIANNFEDMRGKIKGLIGLIDKIFLDNLFFPEQYRHEWGVYIGIEEKNNRTI
ncbi:MAG: hypothetical protein Q7J54_08025 [Candidatus Woesearchaeota archaeon]|nr:hypothetical protein [Candidatus Woesearchaeota archaeon]